MDATTQNGPSDERMAAAALERAKPAEDVKQDQRAAAALDEGESAQGEPTPDASTVWFITYLPQPGDFDHTTVDDVPFIAGTATKVDAATRPRVVNNCRQNPWFHATQDEHEAAPRAPKIMAIMEAEAVVSKAKASATSAKEYAGALRAEADLIDPPA